MSYPDSNFPQLIRYQAYNFTEPETGMVPIVMVNGFVGIKGIDLSTGLNIYPILPSGYSYMQVDDVRYNDRVIKVTAKNNQSGIIIEVEAKSSSATSISGSAGNLTPSCSYTIRNVYGDGTNIAPVVATTAVTTNSNGELTFNQTIGTGDRLIEIIKN